MKIFICEKCGEIMSLDTSKVLTSYPAKYECFCEKCGHVDYIYCSQENEYSWKRIKTEFYESKQEGEHIGVSIDANQTITGSKIIVTADDLKHIKLGDVGLIAIDHSQNVSNNRVLEDSTEEVS